MQKALKGILAMGSVSKWFLSIFSGSSTAPVVGAPGSFTPDPDFHPSLKDVPRYPPFDRGLPLISVDELIKSQQTLIDRIHDADLPYAEQAVKNLANYVHLLPATSSDFFCGAGGLFRLCLEIGFHSFVASQGNIFTSRDPAEKRRELDAKWQLAAFLSGLCCELSRAIVTSVVTNDHGEQWLPFEPITAWLSRSNSQRYFLRPPQASILSSHDTAHLSGVIVNAIIPSEALQHITTDDRTILMSMLSTITRITDTYNSGQFPKTVRHVRDMVIQRDKLSNPLTFGKPLVGVHVEPYLINGMRHLVRNGTWKINQKMARVHIAPDGAYIFWATGVQEVLAMLRDEGAVGIPTDPRTLGELLMNSGVFEPNPDGSLWWYIKTPISPTVYEVVKLSNASIILDDDALATVSHYPGAIAVDKDTAKIVPADSENDHPTESTNSHVDRNVPSIVSGNVAKKVESVEVDVAPVPSHHSPSKPQKDYGKALAMTSKPQGVSPTNASQLEPKASKPQKKTKPLNGPKPASSISSHGSDDVSLFEPSTPSNPVAAAPKPVPSDSIGTMLKRPSLISDMKRLVDFHNQSDQSALFWVDKGLAVPMSVLTSQCDHVPMTVALAEAACLYIAPGQTTKLHTLQHEGASVRSIILHGNVALDFGFHKVDVISIKDPEPSLQE